MKTSFASSTVNCVSSGFELLEAPGWTSTVNCVSSGFELLEAPGWTSDDVITDCSSRGPDLHCSNLNRR